MFKIDALQISLFFALNTSLFASMVKTVDTSPVAPTAASSSDDTDDAWDTNFSGDTGTPFSELSGGEKAKK